MDTHSKEGKESIGVYQSGAGKYMPQYRADPQATKPMSRNGGLQKPKGDRKDGNLISGEMERENIIEGRKSMSHIDFLHVKVMEGQATKPILRNGSLRKPKVRREDGLLTSGEMERNKSIEGRKSVSHIQSNISSAAAFLHVKVIEADMQQFMQLHAFRCARRTYDSLEKFSSKHMAYNMKKEFDRAYGPAWHCIVGTSFGSFVTHSAGGFLYFSMEKIFILIFKTKVERASDI